MTTPTTTNLLNIPDDSEMQMKIADYIAQIQNIGLDEHPQHFSESIRSATVDSAVAFSNGLAHPEVTKKAYEDINHLANNIRSVTTSFQQISSQLRSVDAFSVMWASITDVPPVHLFTKWDDIRVVCAQMMILDHVLAMDRA